MYFLVSAGCWHANEISCARSASTPTSHNGRNSVYCVMRDSPWAAKSKVLWLKKKNLSLQDCSVIPLKLSDVKMGDTNGIGGIKNPSKGFVITLDARCLLWILMQRSEGAGWWCYCNLNPWTFLQQKMAHSSHMLLVSALWSVFLHACTLKTYLFLHSVACVHRLFAR